MSHDELRRQMAEARRAQAEAMPAWREALMQVFAGRDRATVPPEVRADLALGGLTRRNVLRIGGFAVATSAVLAACGSDSTAPRVPQNGDKPPVGKVTPQTITDITLLRTASSLEYAAIDTYAAAVKSGLVTTRGIADAAGLFSDQHREHAEYFEAATVQAGGAAFTKRNDAVWNDVIQPALDSVKTEQDIVRFAFALEGVAAATYQSFMPWLTTPRLRQAFSAVEFVEARHQAVLASVVEGSLPVALPVDPSASTTSAPASTEAGATTTTVEALEQVYAVEGAFQQATSAVGPRSFEYPPAAPEGN